MQEKQEGIEAIKPNQIQRIIDYIENNFPGKDNAVNEHIFYIKSFLKQSLRKDTNEVNIAKIYEGIHYIENIPVKAQRYSLFSQASTIGELMNKQKEILLPERERRQRPINLISTSGAVHASVDQQFGPIHHALVDLILPRYQFLKDKKISEKTSKPSLVWSYDYPVEEDSSEIMNQPIGEWQAKNIKLNPDPKKAYRDFQRDVGIKGITPKTDSEVIDLLEYLLEGSSYSPEERPLIKQWLQANGGQDMNRFLDYLLMSGTFTHEEPASLLNAKSLEQQWSIENGKVVLFYETAIYSIHRAGEICINDGRGQLRVEDDPERIKDKSGNYKVPPLMRVKSKIELNIVDGVITPSITALNVQSYSSNLSLPKPQVLKETPRAM